MRYTLVVCTERAEVLLFPRYGENEYLLAVSVARLQSQHSRWAEVRDGEQVRCRYVQGKPAGNSPLSVWRDDRISHQRQDFTRRAAARREQENS